MSTSSRHRAALALIASAVIVPWSSDPLAAATGRLSFDVWTVEDGLPQSSVNAIEQTPDGYLWLATYGGLVRFDGLRFVVFDRSVDGIGGLRARALHVTRDGTLWAGTDDGMLIRYQRGRFETFDRDDGIPRDVASRIEEDAGGHIWITWATHLTRYDGERFVTVTPADLPHGVRPYVGPSGGGSPTELWWSVRDGILWCLIAGQVTGCPGSELVVAADVIGVSTDQHACIWFATRTDVVHWRAGRHRRYATRPRAPAPAFLDRRDGSVWVGRQPDGAVYRAGDSGEPPLTGAMTLFEDREGSLWAGSISRGLHRLREPVVAMITEADGLSSSNAYAVLRDRHDDVWVGTWGDGVNRLSKGAVAAHYRILGPPHDLITSLFEDAGGRLLVGTTRGLTRVNGRRLVADPDPAGLLAGRIWDIHQDAAGALWFGTEHGLVRERHGSFVRFTTTDGLAEDPVTALHGDRTGALWIGGTRSVTRLRDGVFTPFGEREGLTGNQVRAFHEDADGVLWIGTYDGGLYRLEGDRLTHYTTRTGLHDNGVFQILEDEFGYFWIGSNRGISRVSRAELNAVARGTASAVRSTVFGIRDGLATLECNGGRQPSGQAMPDGTLWIPTQGGIAVVDPRAVGQNLLPPAVAIEEVRVGGQPAVFDAGLEVQPGGTSIEIRYTAITFVRPEQARFRYRLVGLDDGWVDAGSQRAIAYHRLPPGRYRFEVTAANSDGVWNTAGTGLAVMVHAPFWRRGPVMASGAVAVGLVVVAVVRRRFARLRREHEQQRAFALELISAEERERRRISNELHDSLGQDLFMIRARARSFRQEGGTSEIQEVLDGIADVAARSHEDLKAIAYGLRPYQLDKIGLSKTIQGMLARVRESCGIAVDAEIAPVDRDVGPDAAIHVYRIVQEAVNNVARHSGATLATVIVRSVGAHVEIVVRDNGRGLSPAQVQAPSGFGLRNLRERALALGGSMAVTSPPGGGTELRITLPVERADG